MKEENIIDKISRLIDEYERIHEKSPDKILVDKENHVALMNYCNAHYMSGDSIVFRSVPIEYCSKVSGIIVNRENSVRFIIS